MRRSQQGVWIWQFGVSKRVSVEGVGWGLEPDGSGLDRRPVHTCCWPCWAMEPGAREGCVYRRAVGLSWHLRHDVMSVLITQAGPGTRRSVSSRSVSPQGTGRGAGC